jgi:hypothetical protein
LRRQVLVGGDAYNQRPSGARVAQRVQKRDRIDAEKPLILGKAKRGEQ